MLRASLFRARRPGAHHPAFARWACCLILAAVFSIWTGTLQASHAQYESADPYMLRQMAAMQSTMLMDLGDLAGAPRYTIAATLDTVRGRVNGVLDVEFVNRSRRPVSELVFRLYANADYAYSGGSLYVSEARQGNSMRPRRLNRERTTLHVPLSTALRPGEKTSLRLEFTTQAPFDNRQGYGILNRERGILSLAGWYPILAVHNEDGWLTPPISAVGDALLAEISFYEVTLTAPPAEKVIATGTALEQKRVGHEMVWHFVTGPVREFVVVTGRNFSTRTKTVGGAQIRLHTLPSGQQPAVSVGEALETAAAYFQIFNSRFGDYPYLELDIVESPIAGIGYEFPGLIQLKQELRVDALPNDYRFLLAHEIAHQWWFNLVGNHVHDEPWLDEALATYAAAIAWAEADSAESGAALVAYWGETYGPRTADEPPLNAPAPTFGNWSYYQRVIYYQGALFLDELRRELGDADFFALLLAYQQAHRYQFATTADFLAMAEAKTRRDLKPLFMQWFDPETLASR